MATKELDQRQQFSDNFKDQPGHRRYKWHVEVGSTGTISRIVEDQVLIWWDNMEWTNDAHWGNGDFIGLTLISLRPCASCDQPISQDDDYLCGECRDS